MFDRSEKTLRLGGLIAVVLVGGAVAWWASESLRRAGSFMGLSEPIVLAPHRAVYSLSLESSAALSNVTAANGQMVVEVKGAACEGYTLMQRIVSDLSDADGRPTRSDSQFTSWESGSGDYFRFVYQQFTNGNLVEEISGFGERSDGGEGGVIKFTSPNGHELQITPETVFPTEHVIGLIKAARDNDDQFIRTVFDGSSADMLYHAAAYIGREIAAEPGVQKGVRELKEAEEGTQDPTVGHRSWPILLSLFEENTQQSAPQYEMAFRLYDNGISTDIVMDYGRFKLRGALQSIEPLEPSSCLARS